MRRKTKPSTFQRGTIARKNRFSTLLALIILGATVFPTIQTYEVASAHRIDPTRYGGPPWPAKSLYARTVQSTPPSDNPWYYAGRAQGFASSNDSYPWNNYTPGNARPYNGVVALHFGVQVKQNGVWGTWLVQSATFVSNVQIVAAVKEYVRGFWVNTPPASRNPPIVRIAVGTNNSNIDPDVPEAPDPYTSGRVWAALVNELGAWVRSTGYIAQITIAGGNDIELSQQRVGNPPHPQWHTATWTRQWVNGYSSVANHTFYNFGSADGCYPASPNDVCTADNNGNVAWRQDDVWYVSRGVSFARALPQIYYGLPSAGTPNINAKQWQKISLHGYVRYAGLPGKVIFGGSMTQFNSCGGCHNTPQEGWLQLQDMLYNFDPSYHGDIPGQNGCTQPPNCHRTDQDLGWSTDIGNLWP